MKEQSVTSENILRLRELTKEIDSDSKITEYEFILETIKTIINDSKNEIKHNFTLEKKIKCYQAMSLKINNILKKHQFK